MSKIQNSFPRTGVHELATSTCNKSTKKNPQHNHEKITVRDEYRIDEKDKKIGSFVNLSSGQTSGRPVYRVLSDGRIDPLLST
jgi:hypothetical protein